MFWDPFFRLYFRGLCFRFWFWASHWVCTSLFSFYRYHMHCRESVWDEGFYIAFFGGVLWVTDFTCLCAMGIWGSHFKSMRAHISWTLGCRCLVFYIRYRESGNLQHVVRVIFHHLDGIPLTWKLGHCCSATLFGV
jgi:hypothetical protein